MNRRRTFALVVTGLVGLSLLSSACSSGSSASGGSGDGSPNFQGVPLSGAGATFPDPVYEQWIHDFQGIESGAKINYNAIGSGGGVDALTKQTVDFGASDAPLQDSQMSQMPGEVIEVPTVIGGIAIVYNLPGVKELKLDGKTAADIFLKKVTTWNDPAIAQQNPGLNLPSSPIQVVHRSDDSGSTFVFTSWLSDESPIWKKQIGANTTVQWPAGESGKDGSDGVAAAVQQAEGSIGYVSFDYAVSSNLGAASIRSDSGEYIVPSVQSIGAAGGILKLPISQTTNILNSSAPGAYPISTTTYLLIYTDQTDRDKGQTLVDFVHYGLTQGQAVATKLNYAPLPTGIDSQALELLSQVSYKGKQITPSTGA